jgi:hypothetical protein
MLRAGREAAVLCSWIGIGLSIAGLTGVAAQLHSAARS